MGSRATLSWGLALGGPLGNPVGDWSWDVPVELWVWGQGGVSLCPTLLTPEAGAGRRQGLVWGEGERLCR